MPPDIIEDNIETLFEIIREDAAFFGRALYLHKKEKLRDEALMRLLLYTDCSSGDIPRFNMRDYYKSPFGVLFCPVPGKRYWTTVQMDELTTMALKNYVYLGRDLFKPDEESREALFLSHNHRRLSKKAVERIVRKYGSFVSSVDEKRV